MTQTFFIIAHDTHYNSYRIFAKKTNGAIATATAAQMIANTTNTATTYFVTTTPAQYGL